MQSLFVLSTQQSILRVKNGLLLDVNFVHSALLDIHVCRIHNIFSKRVKKRLTFVKTELLNCTSSCGRKYNPGP